MKSSHKGEKSEVTHALKSFSVKHSPSVSSFILLFLSVLLYKGSTKPMHSPVKCIFFFFLWSGDTGPGPEVVQLSQSPEHQLPK